MAEQRPMTIDELTREMERLRSVLEKTNDHARKFELESQIQTIELARKAAILDPLTDINSVTALDLSKLGEAISAANKEIANIEKRNEAIGKAMLLVRGALKAAGLGI